MRRSLVLALALTLGCRGEAPSEAAIVVRLTDALGDAALAPAAREAKLDELRALPLRDAEVARVRDACVALHEAMAEADRLTKSARARVDAFEATPAGERDEKEGASIAALLGESQRALRRSEEVRDACLSGIQTLEIKEGG